MIVSQGVSSTSIWSSEPSESSSSSFLLKSSSPVMYRAAEVLAMEVE